MTEKLNLHQRLVAAKKEVTDIGKQGTAPQIVGGYKYATWDAAAGKIGNLFADHGISYRPSMVEAKTEPWGVTKAGAPIYRATVKMEYTLTNADDPTETETSTWFGIADDTSDKSVQKAATSATKYFLMKLFNLSGAEDTESQSIERGPNMPAAPPPATHNSDDPKEDEVIKVAAQIKVAKKIAVADADSETAIAKLTDILGPKMIPYNGALSDLRKLTIDELKALFVEVTKYINTSGIPF